MSKKIFSQNEIIQDLYDLFHATLQGTVDPKVTNASVGAARTIVQHLNTQLKIKQASPRISVKKKS